MVAEQTTPGQVTLSALQAKKTELRQRANKKNFPKLLEAVNSGLQAPVAFEDEYHSLQQARNCLEHRNGVVGAVDVNHNRSLRLLLPRVKYFVEENGEEVELASGMVIDGTEAPVAIKARREIRERTFALGDRVQFNPSEFHEIAFASFFFANDLREKLPTP